MLNRFPFTFLRCSLLNFFKDRFSRLYVTLGLLTCIILPNPCMNILMGTERLFWNWVDVGLLTFFCLSSTFLRKKTFRFFWWTCCCLEIVQFSHLAYFGTSLSPDGLLLIFHEHQDIFDISYLKNTWFVFPLLLGSYGIGDWLFRLFCSLGTQNSFWRPFCGTILVIYSIALMMTDGLVLSPKRIITLNEQPDWLFHRFCMRTPSISLKKTFFTGACALSQIFLLRASSPISYAPYRLIPVASPVQNIVLILGESLNCNHLSLFGYHRPTTPHLDALSTTSFFLARPAYSAAPQTKTSVMFLFNAVREPDNLKELQGGMCNLFTRAKANGFKTFLITNNTGSRSMGPGIDEVYTSVTLDNALEAFHPRLLQEKQDLGLAVVLKDIALSGNLSSKNFIVLHMRAAHSPYEKNYAQEASLRSFFFDTPASTRLVEQYDKAIRYVDQCFYEIFTTFKEIFEKRGNSSLWMIADHGELFGEPDPETGEKRYGHSHLTLSNLRVPFWVVSLQKPEAFLKQAFEESSHPFSAYDVSKFILRCMGDVVVNTQEDPCIGYATSGLMGDILAYEKKEEGVASLVAR